MDDGFKELQAKLHSLRTDTIGKAQRKALRQVGELVKTAMVENAPDKSVTGSRGGVLAAGELKACIKARVSVPSDEGVVQGKIAKVTIGPSGKEQKLIAHDVEYGHANVKDASAGDHRSVGASRTAPNPFIRRTADETEVKARALYEESITADVEKAMK
jgi:hypothetical protein